MDHRTLYHYLLYIHKTVSESEDDLYAVARLDRELTNLKDHLRKDHEIDDAIKNEILGLRLDYQSIKAILEDDKQRHVLYDFLESLTSNIPYFRIRNFFRTGRRGRKVIEITQPELIRLQNEIKAILDKATALHEDKLQAE